jgi:hypothetical protein
MRGKSSSNLHISSGCQLTTFRHVKQQSLQRVEISFTLQRQADKTLELLCASRVSYNGLGIKGLATNGLGVNGMGRNWLAINGFGVNRLGIKGLGVNRLGMQGWL